MKVNKTITSIFMAPTLGIPLEVLNSHGYINGYSVDGMRFEQYQDAVYLLFKPTNFTKFTLFVEEEYIRGIIIDDYDYDEYVVLVYQLSPAYKTDFDLIKEGKYSETSNIFQELFDDRITIEIDGIYVEENSFQNLIFNKSKRLKKYWREEANIEIPDKNEYWSLYDINNETLKL